MVSFRQINKIGGSGKINSLSPRSTLVINWHRIERGLLYFQAVQLQWVSNLVYTFFTNVMEALQEVKRKLIFNR